MGEDGREKRMLCEEVLASLVLLPSPLYCVLILEMNRVERRYW